MYRGINRFVCDECGNAFTSADIEYCATVYSCPAKCPKCGSWHTMPAFFTLFMPLAARKKMIKASYDRLMYKKIWEQLDKDGHL